MTRSFFTTLLSLILILFSSIVISSCDNSVGFVNPTPRTISSFGLLSPIENSTQRLMQQDSLGFFWQLPQDIGTTFRYTLILDTDDTLDNGRLLTYEIPMVDSTFISRIVFAKDSTGAILPKDTIKELSSLSYKLSYQFLRELPSLSNPTDSLITDSLYYTVNATSTTGATFRSSDLFRFTLILQK